MGKFRIGSPIFSNDGEQAGEVDRVVLDPRRGQVTAIVAREAHQLSRDIVVPIENIRDWNETAVWLKVPLMQLESLPEYLEADFVSPDRGELVGGPYTHGEVLFPVTRVWTSVTEEIPIGKEVECTEGVCGVVDEVMLDPITRRVVSFRLQPCGTLSRSVIVPIEWVLGTRGKRLRLDCNVRQLEELLPSHESQRAASG